MSIARQITTVNMIPSYNNGTAYFPFAGTINSDFLYKAWNLTAEWTPEFYGSATDLALSGRLRTNFRGYRLKVTMQLDNSTESSKIRTLFNYLSAGYDRTVSTALTSGASGGSTSATLSGASPATANYFTGLIASGFNGGDVRITAYSVGRVLTLAESRSWADGATITFKAQPNIPTVILFDIEGTSTVYTDSDLIPCVVVNNSYGLSRQSTIHQQRIAIEMNSIELYQNIPDTYLIG